MALGYVIALALEATGLLGLVVGALRLRTERRARAAELRGLLLTGHAAIVTSTGGRTGANAPAPRRIVVPPPATHPALDSLAARTALHRALGVYTQPERSAA
jgi:hypothetical protein